MKNELTYLNWVTGKRIEFQETERVEICSQDFLDGYYDDERGQVLIFSYDKGRDLATWGFVGGAEHRREFHTVAIGKRIEGNWRAKGWAERN